MAKLHASTYGDALDAFVKAKRECRRHGVGQARSDHDAKTLIASSCFCPKLFPELVLAQRDNKTLRVKWQRPDGSSASPGASTPARGSKRKGTWSQQKGKRGAAFAKDGTPNYIRSPASQPTREHPGVGGVAGKEKGDTGVRPLGAVEAKLPRLVLMPPSSKLEDSPVGGRLSLFQDRWDFFPLGTLGGIHGLEWKWLNTPIASQMGFSSRERRS